MKIRKRALSLLLALILITTSAIPAFATEPPEGGFHDVPQSHWAHDVIDTWANAGVLQGDGDGFFAPERGLSLGELAAILTRTFGYIQREENINVTPSWAAPFVESAVAAGVFDFSENIDARTPVSRERAIRYISLAYNIAPVEGDTTFADNSSIGERYMPYVNAFQQLGYVRGRGGNIFAPQEIYTRAEAMQVMANTTAAILDDSVYGEDFSNTVIIRSAGVRLEGLNIDGNLIIAQGVGDGSVYLEDVSISGNLIILGGGENSINLANAIIVGNIDVRNNGNITLIRISGQSQISAIVLYTGAIIITEELAPGVTVSVTISPEFIGDSLVQFAGVFYEITNYYPGAEIQIQGSVQRLTLNESAAISGTGRIFLADVAYEAGEGTSFETVRPDRIVGEGREYVTLPARPQPPNNDPNGPPPGNGHRQPADGTWLAMFIGLRTAANGIMHADHQEGFVYRWAFVRSEVVRFRMTVSANNQLVNMFGSSDYGHQISTIGGTLSAGTHALLAIVDINTDGVITNVRPVRCNAVPGQDPLFLQHVTPTSHPTIGPQSGLVLGNRNVTLTNNVEIVRVMPSAMAAPTALQLGSYVRKYGGVTIPIEFNALLFGVQHPDNANQIIRLYIVHNVQEAPGQQPPEQGKVSAVTATQGSDLVYVTLATSAALVQPTLGWVITSAAGTVPAVQAAERVSANQVRLTLSAPLPLDVAAVTVVAPVPAFAGDYTASAPSPHATITIAPQALAGAAFALASIADTQPAGTDVTATTGFTGVAAWADDPHNILNTPNEVTVTLTPAVNFVFPVFTTDAQIAGFAPAGWVGTAPVLVASNPTTLVFTMTHAVAP